MLRGRLGEVYNIGGTTTMKVGDFLERLVAKAKKQSPPGVMLTYCVRLT